MTSAHMPSLPSQYCSGSRSALTRKYQHVHMLARGYRGGKGLKVAATRYLYYTARTKMHCRMVRGKGKKVEAHF